MTYSANLTTCSYLSGTYTCWIPKVSMNKGVRLDGRIPLGMCDGLMLDYSD